MQRPPPLVSIIVPSFNAGVYLPVLCRSLQAQTYPHFEVLIGDDASTDQSVEAVTPFLADQRFQYLRWESNRGVNRSTVLLLGRAQGQFWAYPGADDALEPEFLAQRVAFMEKHPQVGMVHGPPLLIDASNQPLPSSALDVPVLKTGPSGMEIIPAGQALKILLQHNLVNTPSVLVRMATTKITFSHLLTDWRYAQDWSFWILHMAAGWDMGFDNRPLNHYRILPSSLSNDPGKQAVRQAEIRLVPLVALARAASFSPDAAQLWMRWRGSLYALWLRRAWTLARAQQLNDAWLQLGAAAYYGQACSRVSLGLELLRHSCKIIRATTTESASRRRQAQKVSGLSQLNHPLFRFP